MNELKFPLEDNDIITIDGENSYTREFLDILKKVKNTRKLMVIGENQVVSVPNDFEIEIIRCSSIGKNIGDFLTMAVLMREFVNGTDNRQFILVSKDHGFDSAIKYLKSTGISIKRLEPDKLTKIINDYYINISNNTKSNEDKTVQIKDSTENKSHIEPIKLKASLRELALAKEMGVNIDRIKNYPPSLLSICGYIAKHFLSGQNANKVKSEIQTIYSKNGDAAFNKLVDLGVLRIKPKRNQIYFSKEQLKRISAIASVKYGG